jgi:DNA-binding protein HU-beta
VTFAHWAPQGVFSNGSSRLIQAESRQAGHHPTSGSRACEQHQLTKKQGLQMLEDLIGMITKHLKKGERVKIAGLGILVVRNRAARMGRNPMTGEPIKIKASRKVAFRAAKDLKMAI